MDEIVNLKNKILKGEDIADNYKKLISMVNNKKKEIASMNGKISKDIQKKTKCSDIKSIQNKIDILNNKDILDHDFLTLYREVLSNINYLEDYYTTNSATIKKIGVNGTKVSLNKI